MSCPDLGERVQSVATWGICTMEPCRARRWRRRGVVRGQRRIGAKPSDRPVNENFGHLLIGNECRSLPATPVGAVGQHLSYVAIDPCLEHRAVHLGVGPIFGFDRDGVDLLVYRAPLWGVAILHSGLAKDPFLGASLAPMASVHLSRSGWNNAQLAMPMWTAWVRFGRQPKRGTWFRQRSGIRPTEIDAS